MQALVRAIMSIPESVLIPDRASPAAVVAICDTMMFSRHKSFLDGQKSRFGMVGAVEKQLYRREKRPNRSRSWQWRGDLPERRARMA